jgi:hypothetical protein
VTQAARGTPPAPIGVVYNTSMTRPDAALALAALYVLENKRESRVGAVCVTGAGLDTAIFCDIVARFYTGPARSSNSVLPVGLADVTPLPPDSPMVKAAVNRKKENGDPQYLRSVRKLTDTSVAEAVLRNGVLFNVESAIVLSAPATRLARSLELAGTKDQYKQRVKRLVIVDAGAGSQDPAALRNVVAEWPGPICFCGREVGETLPFPGARLDQAFAWAPAHPVVDAYHAFKPMPYDVPSNDLAAIHYAVHPESGFFSLSNPGTLSITDDGGMKFAEGNGTVRRLIVDPAKKDQTVEALVAIASTAPVAPAGRGRSGD